MSKLDEQLADYFGALHDDDGLGDELPPYALADRALVPPPPNRRRMALVLVGVVVVALAAVGLVKSSEDSSPHVETPADERPAPPPVPEGWKPVIFQTVQFSVPADWPVHDDGRCADLTTDGVYLGPDSFESADVGGPCSGPLAGVIVQATGYTGDASEFAVGGADQMVDDTQANVTSTRVERALNGLAAVVELPPDEYLAGSYVVALVDDDVLVSITFAHADQRPEAEQIIETIGAAPQTPTTSSVPSPTATSTIPVAPTEVPATVPPPGAAGEGDLDAWCAAIEGFRGSGMTGPQGYPTVEAIPSFQAMVDAAPEAFRPPVQTMLDWLVAGAPEPRPSGLDEAALQTTRDWAANCSGSNARTAEERAQSGR